MALIVETGDLIANANSYATVAEADAYLNARGRADWAALPSERKEQLMILAADYLNTMYVWAGEKYDLNQSMSLPTSWIDMIPAQVKYAQFLLAYEAKDAELATSVSGPSVKLTEKSLDGVGSTKTEYKDDAPFTGRSFPLIDALVSRFTTSAVTSKIQSARRLLG